MKTKKEALRAARLLLKGVMAGGTIDEGKVRTYTQRIIAEKPRHYVGILEAFSRLLRLEKEKRHAIIESAEPLSSSLQASMLNDLKTKFGADLTSEFKTNADLIGGVRVKVGSNIWDGSIKSRLESLRQQFAA